MDWLNDLKEKFSRRRIRSLDRTKEYSRDFVDLETARNIGLIVNVSQITKDELDLIHTYVKALKKRDKKLLVIELNFQKKSLPILAHLADAIFLNPSKLNWLDYPTPALENEIRRHELDILMDFDSSNRMTSKYLCSMARAKTRTGVHREGFESCYELMIDREDVPTMKAMIKEFDYFLNMIDNGNKVKVKS